MPAFRNFFGHLPSIYEYILTSHYSNLSGTLRWDALPAIGDWIRSAIAFYDTRELHIWSIIDFIAIKMSYYCTGPTNGLVPERLQPDIKLVVIERCCFSCLSLYACGLSMLPRVPLFARCAINIVRSF